eukprot:4599398-Alexandrium_andersonii.AAC.1
MSASLVGSEMCIRDRCSSEVRRRLVPSVRRRGLAFLRGASEARVPRSLRARRLVFLRGRAGGSCSSERALNPRA